MNDLITLISRMNPAEKQYFKRQTKLQEGETKYLQLFDEIQRLLEKHGGDPKPILELGDEKLRRHFQQRGIRSQITPLKNYLMQHLLRSLRHFNESKTARHRLQAELDEAEILLKKGIYELAAERLETLLPELEKFEFFDLALRAVEKMLSLTHAKTLKKFEDSNFKWLEKRQEILKKIEVEQQMNNWFDQIFLFARQGKSSNVEATRQQLIEFDRQLEATDPAQLTTFKSRRNFFHAKAVLAYNLQQNENCQNQMEKVMQIWQENPHFLEESPAIWSMNASNYLNFCHLNKNYTPFPAYLKKFSELPAQHFDDAGEIFQNLAQAELLYRMNHPEVFASHPLPDGIRPDEEFIAWVEAGIQTFYPKINRARLITLHHNLLIWMLSRDRWQAALDKVAVIQNLGRSEQRQDFQSGVKIFELLLFFDLHFDDRLEAKVKNARQQISYNEYLFDFERLALYYFARLALLRQTKLPLEVVVEQTHDLLGEFHADLQKFTEKFAGRRVAGLEEVSIWVEARWRGVAFLEVLRERILAEVD